jgi:hypothetical protein
MLVWRGSLACGVSGRDANKPSPVECVCKVLDLDRSSRTVFRLLATYSPTISRAASQNVTLLPWLRHTGLGISLDQVGLGVRPRWDKRPGETRRGSW